MTKMSEAQANPMIKVATIILPDKPLSNFELLDAVNKLKIKNFRGVFMRDELPKKVKTKECGILNSDASADNSPGNNGTHWVCWFCSPKKNCYYFDSFWAISTFRNTRLF